MLLVIFVDQNENVAISSEIVHWKKRKVDALIFYGNIFNLLTINELSHLIFSFFIVQYLGGTLL